MPSVCFTGAGKRFGTDTFTRVDWEALAQTRGWIVVDKVARGTTLLVASRTDTVKADAARALDVAVATYAEFERCISPTRHIAVTSSSRVVYDANGEAMTYPVDRNPATVVGERASGVPRGHCPVHMSTLDANGTCLDCARLERRRGMSPGQHASRVNAAIQRPPAIVQMMRGCYELQLNDGSPPVTYADYAGARRALDEFWRREAVPVDGRPRCTPHGFIADECRACAANAAAEQERARLAQIEQERIEAARLPPIGVLTGRRKLNLGDD